MPDLTITAQSRTLSGKKTGRLRRAGLMPAVLYGPAIDAPRSLQLDAREFDSLYRTAGTTQLIDLVVDGRRQRVFIRDIQFNLLKRRVDHVDFYAANLNVETTMAVPVVLAGEAPVAARGEGVISQVHLTVTVRALPTNVPAHFEVDAGRIESIDDDVRVGDLTAPDGVTIVDDPDTVLVAVTRATVEEEVVEVAEVAADTAEAAEAADAATDETGGAAADENA